MAVSYNKLWKLLVDKKMSKADLRKAANVAPNTMTKLRRDEPVTLTIQFKRDPDENGVLITTARKFKGLENKVIIITDIDEICFSDSAIKKVFYVACSRATHHLSLLIGGGSEKIASIAAAIPGTGFSGKGKIVLKTKTKPLKI